MTVKDGLNGWVIVTLDGVARDSKQRMPNMLAFKFSKDEGQRATISIAADLDKGVFYSPAPGGCLRGTAAIPVGFERLGDTINRADSRASFNFTMLHPQPDSSIEKLDGAHFDQYVRFDGYAPHDDRSFGMIMGALRGVGLPISKADEAILHDKLISKELAIS